MKILGSSALALGLLVAPTSFGFAQSYVPPISSPVLAPVDCMQSDGGPTGFCDYGPDVISGQRAAPVSRNDFRDLYNDGSDNGRDRGVHRRRGAPNTERRLAPGE
jgi:hypothetical protein